MEPLPVAWIDTVDEKDATGEVAAAYARAAGPDGTVENLYKAMSLTPAVIKPADEHYLALLHDPGSPLAPWLAELLATHVAMLCGSRYVEMNHGRNFRTHFGDDRRSRTVLEALRNGRPGESGLEVDEQEAVEFARKLTLFPERMSREDIETLREVGFDDTAISYIAQISASFAYWSRITNALGIRLDDATAPKPQACR